MANKRIRSTRPPSSRDLFDGLDSPAPRKRRSIAKRAQTVENEIHRLECMIAAAPQIEARQKLRRRNYVPPAEELIEARPTRKRRVPLHQQRSLQRHRTFQLIQFGVLLLAIAAVAGWMKQWLQF